jgi:hypothetical protein
VDQRRDRVVVLTSEEFVPGARAGQVQVLEDGRGGACTPWVSRLLPPAPAATTGTVTMLDLARVPA